MIGFELCIFGAIEQEIGHYSQLARRGPHPTTAFNNASSIATAFAPVGSFRTAQRIGRPLS
jgi:hypothetical protein